MFSRFSIWYFLLPILLLPTGGAAADSKLNRNAQALAKHLAPSPPAGKYRKEDIANLGKRLRAAMELLEKSYRGSGPSPESLVTKALSFRDDLGQYEKMLLSNSLISAWREASAYGMFDDNGNFQPEVREGKGVGDKMMFELIVPGEVFPEASNQLANVRMVRFDERRTEEGSMTLREKATRDQLQKMLKEKADRAARKKWESHRTNALGQTEEEALYLWENEMAQAGDLAKEMPNVRVRGDSTGTPSRMTKHRWRTLCEISNISTFPTEVKVEIWLIGYTWKNRDHYVMTKVEKTMKLRRNHSTSFEVFSKPERSYKNPADDLDGLNKNERKRSRVRYRGYAIRVTHEKGLVSFTGSDQLLESYVDPSVEDRKIESLPVF